MSTDPPEATVFSDVVAPFTRPTTSSERITVTDKEPFTLPLNEGSYSQKQPNSYQRQVFPKCKGLL